jgi:O-antigen ligase
LAVLVGAALPLLVRDVPDDVARLLPVALVVLICATYVAFARPAILIVGGFALLGFVRFEPAPVDLVFALLMVTSLLAGRVRPQLPVVVGAPLVLLAALTILSSVNATDAARAARFELITLYLIALSVWLTSVFRDRGVARAAMKAYVLAAAALALVSTVALELGFPGGDVLLYDAFRAEGLFKDPNVFGPFLVPAAAIVLEDLLRPRLFAWRRSVLVVLLASLLAGILVAYSRAAWLNLAVAFATIVLVYAWRRGGFATALKAVALLAAAGAAGLGLLVATGSLSFLEQRSGIQLYDADRFGTQTAALARMTDTPFGHGPGQVEATLDLATHSLYVRVGFEQGLPGAVVLVILLLVTIGLAFRLAVKDAEVAGVGSAALLGSWLGLLVNSMFVDTFHWRQMWIIAALIWAGSAVLSGVRSRSPG